VPVYYVCDYCPQTPPPPGIESTGVATDPNLTHEAAVQFQDAEGNSSNPVAVKRKSPTNPTRSCGAWATFPPPQNMNVVVHNNVVRVRCDACQAVGRWALR
jgi:hypothetical protein